MQQESETIKKLIKEKTNIKNMIGRITKLRKRSKSILGHETREEIKKLKTTAKLEENFKVTELQQRKPKIKIITVGKEEIKLDDGNLIEMI